MIHENFIYLGFILSSIGCISYLIDTVKGKTKPNRVTWFLWALAPLIAFTAEIKEGVGLTALMTFSVGFNPLLIFLASFINKKSEWKLTRFDFVCGSFSVLGLLFWYITQVGNVAIFFSIVADLMAGVPTIIKSYKEPETGISGLITLLTIKTWNFAHYGFPLYIFLICAVFYSLIHFKLGKQFQKNDIMSPHL